MAVLCCRKYYGVTSGALHPCNRCSAAFFLRPSIVSFRKNLSVRTGDSLSASAVMKGVDAYDFLIGFRRKREVNPMNKRGNFMKEKRISFGQGKGSLTHNNREFMADNVDPLRTPQNITFVRQPIGEAYNQLFAESTARYNAKQKRNDRKVHGSYYEHLFGVKPCNTVRTAADKRKSFYEDVVQIGKREDSGYGTEDFQLVADCLKEYMEGFQNRNPNFYVFNAVLHMDEATPHLHIDYIPVGHYKRGQDVQNGIAQALKEMGFGEGKQAIARRRAAEVEVLNAICLEHGIKSLVPEKARGTLEVEEYKEQRRQADELALQNVQVEAQIAVKKAVLSTTETQLEEQQKLLGDTQEQVREATADLMEQTRKIEDGETELSEMIDKVEKKKQEYQRIEKNANDILNFIPSYEKDDQAERDFELIQTTLGGLTRNAMAAMKNRDEINVQVGELCKILKKALNKVHKYSITIGEQRQLLHKIEKLNDELTDKNKSLYSRNRELSADNNTLKKKYDTVMAVYRKVESIAPEAITQAKMLVEAERQREQELQQLEAQSRKKKKSWGLE